MNDDFQKFKENYGYTDSPTPFWKQALIAFIIMFSLAIIAGFSSDSARNAPAIDHVFIPYR